MKKTALKIRSSKCDSVAVKFVLFRSVEMLAGKKRSEAYSSFSDYPRLNALPVCLLRYSNNMKH